MSYSNRQPGFTDPFLDDSEELVNLVTKEFVLEDITSAVLELCWVAIESIIW